MALSKEITKDSGLVVKYHRISDIEINYLYKICTITIEEYISEEYRNKAKEVIDIKKQLTNLTTQIEATEDLKIKEALINKFNLISIDRKDFLQTDFSAGKNVVNLDFIPDDTTYTGFYNELKKLELYKDADLI